MKPKHRNKRIAGTIIYGLLALAGTFLLIQALGDNKQLFVNPNTVLDSDFAIPKNDFRVGGLVAMGSVVKINALTTHFSIVNFEENNAVNHEAQGLEVIYNGVLPDLFREGQGVVVLGRLGSDQNFMAAELLAKHDENYMPKMAKN